MRKQKLGTILVYRGLQKIMFLSKYYLKKNLFAESILESEFFRIPLIILLNFSKTQQQTLNPIIHLIQDHKELDKPVHNFLARTFQV